jgi:hypothetical protein
MEKDFSSLILEFMDYVSRASRSDRVKCDSLLGLLFFVARAATNVSSPAIRKGVRSDLGFR